MPQILRGIADALDYAHAHKVIHRDVKPTNIFLKMNDGKLKEVMLIDFGIAAEIQMSMTHYTSAKINTSGTRPYMPPEQWLGQKQDAKTDQYALGVVAYELYSGHLPFMASDFCILRDCVLRYTPKKIDGLPAHINAALQRALAKKREDRQ